MNKSLIISVVATIIAVTALAFIFLAPSRAPRLAYVRSSDVVEQYAGMKEAKLAYDEKVKNWLAVYDSLNVKFEKELAEFENRINSLSGKKKEEAQMQLEKKRNELMRYMQNIEQKAQKEEGKLVQGALNQINSFVEEYAKEKGFDMVLGTTADGSIIYGDKSMDITEEVIMELNKNYRK